MPELPEVETIRLQLFDLIRGKTIRSVTVLKTTSFVGDSQTIVNKAIRNVGRLAKMIIISFDGENILGIHLKMSGQLLTKTQDALIEKHTRVVITFTDRSMLFFNDMRTFGWMKIFSKQQLEELRTSYGPDPLGELAANEFQQILQTSRRAIKMVLMDQQKIAGVGNIYANEALFLAKINPKTPARNIDSSQSKLLLTSLRAVLNNGIKYKGATRENFRDVYGKKGSVQDFFAVYNRKGRTCPNDCGGTIKKISLGGRGTFFCPTCQKEGNIRIAAAS